MGVGGGFLGQKCSGQDDKRLGVLAQPADIREMLAAPGEDLGEQIMSVNDRGRVRRLRSLFPRPLEKPLPPGIPAFLEGSYCWTVESSQHRLFATGLGFCFLPHPSRAGLPWSRGSDREEKRGFSPRGAECSRTAPALSGTYSEPGGARAGFLFIIFPSQAGWTS